MSREHGLRQLGLRGPSNLISEVYFGNNRSFVFTAGVTGIASLIGHKESRDGHDYMKVEEFKFSIGVKHADVHMNNLFNGNKELGK
jgi:hypothetical protein